MPCDNLSPIYKRRFQANTEFRKKMWKVLCGDFFQKYISPDDTVMEIGAGYCEFINNIRARRKLALDLNPDIKNYAAGDVEVIVSDSSRISGVEDGSCDAVFASNFFEHLTKEETLATVKEIHRILKPGGEILILQPNIRFCYRDYWNFFDHITPLDDRSLSEALETNGFKVVECRPKFLPFSTKSNFPQSAFLVRLYLRLPALHRVFGRQAFIRAISL